MVRKLGDMWCLGTMWIKKLQEVVRIILGNKPNNVGARRLVLFSSQRGIPVQLRRTKNKCQPDRRSAESFSNHLIRFAKS